MISSDTPSFKLSEMSRSVQLVVGNIERSDGSACLSHGCTCVLAAVNGPVQVRAHKECTDKAYIEVYYRSKSGLQSNADKTVEDFLSQTCEQAILTQLHPRTAINITVQELHNDGSVLSCATNACCQALINGGVPMKYMFAGATAAVTKNSEIVIDPTLLQLEVSVAIVNAVYESKSTQLLSLDTQGTISTSMLLQCLEKCKQQCGAIFKFYRTHLSEELRVSEDEVQNINMDDDVSNGTREPTDDEESDNS